MSKPLLRWGGDGRPLRGETAEPEVHPTSTKAHSTSTEAHSTSTAHRAVRKPKNGAGITPANGREAHSILTTPHAVDQPKDGAGRMSGTSGKPTMEPSAAKAPHSKSQQQIAAAETGRPETSQEYARHMRDRFVLLGPGQ